jgi:gag-polypeptide of LTR copia-type
MAKECLECLSARFEGRGGHKISQLMNQLFSTPLNNTKPLEPQINVMIDASYHLMEAGSSFTSQQVAHAITNALPMSHHMLKVVLNNLSTAKQTSENVKVHILTNEDSCIHESGDSAAAFYAKAAKKGKDGKKKLEKKEDKDKGKGDKGKHTDQQRKHYTHCKFIGHDVTECRKLKV